MFTTVSFFLCWTCLFILNRHVKILIRKMCLFTKKKMLQSINYRIHLYMISANNKKCMQHLCVLLLIIQVQAQVREHALQMNTREHTGSN